MRARSKNPFHRPNCVFCGTLETVRHTICASKFYSLAADIVLKALRLVCGDIGLLWDMHTLLVMEALLLLKWT